MSGHYLARPRFLHGLISENPMAFTPSAYEFFHPESPADTGPVPQSTQSSATATLPPRGAVGGETLVLFGLLTVVLLALVIFYVSTRLLADARGMHLPFSRLAHSNEKEVSKASSCSCC